MVYTPQLFLQINDEVILQERKITNTTIKMTYPEISYFFTKKFQIEYLQVYIFYIVIFSVQRKLIKFNFLS